MLGNKDACDKFDLSSVKALFTGAAPLGVEPATAMQKWQPTWHIRQGYGMYGFSERWYLNKTC